MKLYGLIVFNKQLPSGDVNLLRGAYDVQSFSFFQRNSITEFMRFTGKILVERNAAPSRSSVKEQEYMCHCYVREDGLSAVLIADTEYPTRVAFTLLGKVLEDFTITVERRQWSSLAENSAPYNGLDALLAKYQNPAQADALTKVQTEIDETKVILHNTIASVLDRGEKLDDLVGKSEELSAQSKMFYTQARKMNSCCSWF